MVVPVTLVEQGPLYRFATAKKRGDRVVVAFVIEGQAALVSHTWRAQVRGRGNRLIAALGVSVAQYTVTTANDSLRVEMEMNAAGSASLKPGLYLVDCEDVTAAETWASGTLQILQDWSH